MSALSQSTRTTTTQPRSGSRSPALVVARVVAGIAATMGLAGVSYFTVFARDQAQFISPWVDIPLITWKVSICIALLAVALAPRLHAATRIKIGLVAAVADLGFTAIKVVFYNEPEAVTFAVVDLIIIGLLLVARRGRTPDGRG